MNAVIIGGCGHIGSYLVPKLVDEGMNVTVISRGLQKPYTSHLPQWEKVNFVNCDREEMTRKKQFGKFIVDLNPDIICDITSFTLEDVSELCDEILEYPSLCEKLHLIHVGTIWIYGYKIQVPVDESHPRTGETSYGINKTKIENYLLDLTKQGKIKTTIIHPGHISAPGWWPVNPQGNINPQVYVDIKAGKEIMLPDDGSATLHHVHADDLATLILECLGNSNKSVGESFIATSQQALTMRGFAELLYGYFGRKPKIKYMPLNDLVKVISEIDAEQTVGHVVHSSACSMQKAFDVFGYKPKYSSIDTIIQSLEKQIELGNL